MYLRFKYGVVWYFATVSADPCGVYEGWAHFESGAGASFSCIHSSALLVVPR